MNYKRKTLIFSIFLIISIQILLFINNNQKTSFRYFIWNIQNISVGRLICISFISGLIMSSILNQTQNNNNKTINNIKENQGEKADDNDFLINKEGLYDSTEIPPERDVREPQPTISVNYRVIKNNGENEIKDGNQTSNDTRDKDDWINYDSEW